MWRVGEVIRLVSDGATRAVWILRHGQPGGDASCRHCLAACRSGRLFFRARRFLRADPGAPHYGTPRARPGAKPGWFTHSSANGLHAGRWARPGANGRRRSCRRSTPRSRRSPRSRPARRRPDPRIRLRTCSGRGGTGVFPFPGRGRPGRPAFRRQKQVLQIHCRIWSSGIRTWASVHPPLRSAATATPRLSPGKKRQGFWNR